jgi:hypothetical protein
MKPTDKAQAKHDKKLASARVKRLAKRAFKRTAR